MTLTKRQAIAALGLAGLGALGALGAAQAAEPLRIGLIATYSGPYAEPNYFSNESAHRCVYSSPYTKPNCISNEFTI